MKARVTVTLKTGMLDPQGKGDRRRLARDMGGLVEAYTEVARRLGIMQENEQPRATGPKLVQ